MNVFITGINGFIGSHLARYLKEKNITVHGGSAETDPRKDLEPVLSGYFPLRFEDEYAPEIFAGIDILIHCAYSYDRKDIISTNIDGAKKWFFAAKDMGVKKQVFLTSYSAKPDSRSDYGFIKYELELFFLRQQQLVVRPGLVLGDGGIFRRMSKVIKSFPVLPLMDGGNYDVPIISVEALCRATEKILPNRGPAQYALFQEEMVSMKQLMQEMKKQLGAKCLFLPIPSVFPLMFLKALEALHIPFPIKSGSIVALKENQALSLQSSLAELGIDDKPLSEILKNFLTSGGQGLF